MKRTYLDWASAAPVSKAAWHAFERAAQAEGNPSAPHAEGRAAKEILETARVALARMAEAKAEDVIFTSGATEANNLAIFGYAQTLRTADHAKTMHLLYSPTAHASVIEAVNELRKHGVEAESLTLTDGAIDLAALKKQIRPETALVCIDAVCGETGTRFATRDVRRTLDEVRSGIVLHMDASQLPRIRPFELTRLGADLLTLDAQKVGGVRGIGALIRRHGIPLMSVVHGGGQEHGLRAGTELPAHAAAFAAALEEAKEQRDTFSERAPPPPPLLIGTIRTEIPDVEVNGGKQYAPHILNLSFPGRDTDYAVALLDEAGFAVSTKSACETDAEGSHVVLALTGSTERASSTLRISWGYETSKKDMKSFAEALVRTIRFLDAHRL